MLVAVDEFRVDDVALAEVSWRRNCTTMSGAVRLEKEKATDLDDLSLTVVPLRPPLGAF